MIGPIVKNVRWRVTAAAALVVLPLVALACSSPGGGVPGAPPVPRPIPTSTLDRDQSFVDEPLVDANTAQFDMTCGGKVATQSFSFPQPGNTVNIDAPATVSNGQQFTVWVTPGDWTVPAQASGYNISSVVNFILVMPLSPHVQFVDAVMTGSVPTNLGYPQIQKVGPNLVYTLDGPMTGGATISLPRVKLTLIANGAEFDEIDYGMLFMKVTAKIPNAVTHTNSAVGVVCKPTTSDPFNYSLIWSQ
jgi:hypothetical protein